MGVIFNKSAVLRRHLSVPRLPGGQRVAAAAAPGSKELQKRGQGRCGDRDTRARAALVSGTVWECSRAGMQRVRADESADSTQTLMKA